MADCVRLSHTLSPQTYSFWLLQLHWWLSYSLTEVPEKQGPGMCVWGSVPGAKRSRAGLLSPREEV